MRIKINASQKVGMAKAATESTVTCCQTRSHGWSPNRRQGESRPEGNEERDTGQNDRVRQDGEDAIPTGVALLSEMPRSPRARLLTHLK